jgi:hypothetical protein
VRAAFAALAFIGMTLAGPAAAQQQLPNVLFKGGFTGTGPGGYDEQTLIFCRGMPTCAGEYKAHARRANCINYLDSTGSVLITGLNLTQSGSVQGTVRVTTVDIARAANGICTHTGPVIEEQASFTGTWNLATQRGTLHVVFGPGDELDVHFTADLLAPAEIFAMKVRAQIGTQTATASVDINFRSQDVGRNGGVFVFASAPATRVQGGLEAKATKLGLARTSSKADPPTPCVLAQVSPATGQLVAVSAGQLQAYTTGAFSAQGTSVSILDNTPVAGVSGATFYVGYGTDGSTMINDAVYRNAVLIPGNSVCPMLPYQTALFWNPGESGWGLNLNHQGSLAFATLFTYDAARAPLWLVMPAGALQTDGLSFTGDLYRTTGPAFNATPFNPAAVGVSQVGSMTISFSEQDAGTLSYTMNGTAVEKNIQRQVYGARSANCLPTTESLATSTNYQDLWWNASESGWGINITHQDNTLFATLFTYDAAGRDLWLVMSAGNRQGDGSYLGDLYRTTGSPFDSIPFVPLGTSDVTLAGTMRLRFTDGNNGTLTYTYDGASVTKAITRQVFSTPVSACN